MKKTVNDSKYLIKAKELVKKVTFATKTVGPLYDCIHNLKIGMQRTYAVPFDGPIEWNPNDGFHCALSFELWIPNPDKPHTFFRWSITRGVSGATIEEFIDNAREMMRMVDRNKANVEKGLALLHVQNMKRIENEEIARRATGVSTKDE